jgi:acylphosphatase
MTTAKIIVNGLVQGVGYRYFCYKKSKEFNLTGYAENLFNGDVELEVEGDKSMILDFVKELKIGPQNSRVKSVKYEFVPYQNKYDEFRMY